MNESHLPHSNGKLHVALSVSIGRKIQSCGESPLTAGPVESFCLLAPNSHHSVISVRRAVFPPWRVIDTDSSSKMVF